MERTYGRMTRRVRPLYELVRSNGKRALLEFTCRLNVLLSISAECRKRLIRWGVAVFGPCSQTFSDKKKNVEISHCRVADEGENDSRIFA